MESVEMQKINAILKQNGYSKQAVKNILSFYGECQ